MPEIIETENKQSIFSSSVILFLIPAYLYLCAFQFEKGACDFYKIPRDLITPDLTTNLTYCISFFGSIYFAYIGPHIIVSLFFYEKIQKNAAIFPFIRANCILILVGYFSFIAVTYPIDWLKTAPFLLVLIAFFNFLAYGQYIHLKAHLKTKPYNQIAKEWNETVNVPETILAMPDALNLRWTVFKEIKMPQPIVFVVIVAIAWWSYNMGQRDAYKKNIYEIFADKPEWVLLKKYGDNLIMKNFNPKTKALGDSLLIIKISPTNGLKFITKEIGTLHTNDITD